MVDDFIEQNRRLIAPAHQVFGQHADLDVPVRAAQDSQLPEPLYIFKPLSQVAVRHARNPPLSPFFKGGIFKRSS
jgi:hypothetical protein